MRTWMKQMFSWSISVSLAAGMLSAPVYAEGEVELYGENQCITETAKGIRIEEDLIVEENLMIEEKPMIEENLMIEEKTIRNRNDVLDDSEICDKEREEEDTELASCRITFHANGGTGGPEIFLVNEGDFCLPRMTPDRLFYTFLGWAGSPDAELAEWMPGEIIYIDSDRNLYAVWQEAEYPILNNSYPLNVNAELTMEGQKVIYCLTPDQNRMLHIESFTNEDTKLSIFNSAGELLAADDDGGTDWNFACEYLFQAGESYYLEMYYYDYAVTGDISFEVRDLSFSPESLPETKKFQPMKRTSHCYSSFTPARTGTYCFVSAGLSDTDIILETDDHTPVGYDDNSAGDDLNFFLVAKLEAGKTYRITVRNLSQQADPVEVTLFELKKLELVKDLPDTIEGKDGDDAVLSVEAEGNGVTYFWQKSEDGIHWIGMPDFGFRQTSIRIPLSLSMDGCYYRCFIQDAEDNSLISTETRLSVKKTVRFTDLKEDAYYFDAVQWAVDHGITGGKTETTFAPDEKCTRAQVVTFLWRYYGSPDPASESIPFVDVKANTPFTRAILWAMEQGITSGVDSTHFQPDAPVTRAQFVTFLWRAMGKPQPTLAGNSFVDVQSGTPFYQAILWAYEKSITKGTDASHFAPDQSCTRGQVVTFLYRGSR